MQFVTDDNRRVPTVSAARMRQVDDRMINVFHIELLQMMENAGRNLADFTESLFATELAVRAPATITILVGSGGNGGGGLVAARHLTNRGHTVQVVSAVPVAEFAPVPVQQAASVQSMGVKIEEFGTTLPASDILLDCLLGYSLVGNPRDAYATLIIEANNSEVPILTLDTPSGLDVTSGEPQSPCIKALATLTLAFPKTGFLSAMAQPYLGDIYVADISVPAVLYTEFDNLVVPEQLFAPERIRRLCWVDA